MAKLLESENRVPEGNHVGQVENEKMLLARCGSGLGIPLARELEMVLSADVAEHDPIEPIVIVELPHHFEAQSVTIEAQDFIQVTRGASDPEVCKHAATYFFFFGLR